MPSVGEACRLIQVDPKTVRRMPDLDDSAVRGRLHGLGAGRRHFDCRRLENLLEGQSIGMNKKLFWL